MTYTQAVVLGVVQGLTEFLPVSSSGHLILVPHVFGWPDQGLAFDAAMHLGTLAALFAYFRRELRDLLTGVLSRQVGLVIVAASVPALAVGWLLNKWIEANLRGALIVAFSTAFWGVVMWIADRTARQPAPAAGDPLERVGWARALAIGCAQTLALIPGTSRSGITITAGLFAGLERSTAARFSFLLGIPVTAAAGGYKALGLFRHGLGSTEGGPLLVAIVAAFVSGWLAVWFLVGYLQRRSLLPFVVYRLILAAVIVGVVFM
ncbi:MAG TPA: undecaprenyl-diphosphate phosphatase [Methylomirabilota bacterium]|nr:undecaprenyl-diphosphate phosphatase [Methylomirabilota bacterium]